MQPDPYVFWFKFGSLRFRPIFYNLVVFQSILNAWNFYTYIANYPNFRTCGLTGNFTQTPLHWWKQRIIDSMWYMLAHHKVIRYWSLFTVLKNINSGSGWLEVHVAIGFSMATTRWTTSFLGESCCHKYLVVLTMMKSGQYTKTASRQDQINFGKGSLFQPPDFNLYTFLFRGWSLEDIDGAPAEYLVVLSCPSRLQYSTSVH